MSRWVTPARPEPQESFPPSLSKAATTISGCARVMLATLLTPISMHGLSTLASWPSRMLTVTRPSAARSALASASRVAGIDAAGVVGAQRQAVSRQRIAADRHRDRVDHAVTWRDNGRIGW